jgi:hypothetical protein
VSRGPYPGWSLVEDGYLDEPEPVVPEPPRRFGCLSFAALVLVLVAGVPSPRSESQLAETRQAPQGTAVALSGASDVRGDLRPGNGMQVGFSLGGPEVLNPMTAGTPTRSGTWAYAERSYGPGYLAIPEGRGWVVTVCGPLDCIERLSTDAGPALYLQRAGRIGDLASVMFLEICGPLAAGLCAGSYTIIGRPDQSGDDPAPHKDDERMRLEVRDLPATDTLGAVK